MASTAHIPESPLRRFLFADTRPSVLWLALRVYVGWARLQPGLHKVSDPAWTGANAGQALSGFLKGALSKSGGEPQVSGRYARLSGQVALPNASTFSCLVAFGEVAVILGLFTGVVALLGGLRNADDLLAGTLSSNPLLFIRATWVVLAWRVAGWWGLDRWALPRQGVQTMLKADVRVAEPTPKREPTS